MLSNILIFDKIVKIPFFVKILKIVAKYLIYSIFRAEVFAKLSWVILSKLSVPQH